MYSQYYTGSGTAQNTGTQGGYGQQQYQAGQTGMPAPQTYKPPTYGATNSPQNPYQGYKKPWKPSSQFSPDLGAVNLPQMPTNVGYQEWSDWMAKYKHLIPFQDLQNYQWQRPQSEMAFHGGMFNYQ